MIVGCYSVDLYCDNPEHPYEVYYGQGDSYAGKNERECLKQADAAGWLITKERQICPHCRKQKARPKP